MVTLTRVTRGLAVGSTDAVDISTRLISAGILSSDPEDWDLVSVPNYMDTVGEISLYQLPDGSGIRVSVTPTFPDDYAGLWFVLRGRYEYKRNTTDSSIVTLYASIDTDSVEFVDTDIEPSEENTFYYYSVIALCGDIAGSNPYHFEFNPLTGFASGYRYKTDYGFQTFMLDRLPEVWFKENTTTLEGFISIFSTLLETLRSDIETYMFSANSIYGVEESHLQSLASIIGWNVNRETNELKQRAEVGVATSLYKRKGRDRFIEFIVQSTTGWDLSFEHGYRRLAAPGIGFPIFDPNDTRRLALIGAPERRVLAEEVGTSDGTADQTFDLVNYYTRDVHVEVDGLGWLEVSDLSTSGATDQHYSVSQSSGLTTITFGDGVNGAIPGNTLEITADYFYGGDEYTYLPTSNTWKSPTGTRMILNETSSSRPITSGLVRRIRDVVNRYKASYAIYDFVVGYDPIAEYTRSAHDSFDDEILSVEFILMDTEDHQMDTEGYVMPISPA